MKKPPFLFFLDNLVITLAFFCWTFPIAFGFRFDSAMRIGFLLVPILVLIYKIVVLRQKFEIRQSHLTDGILGLGFAVLWVTAMLRTAFDVLDINTLYTFSYLSLLFVMTLYLLFACSNYGEDPQRGAMLRFSAIMASGLYVVVNLLAFALGIRQPDQIYLANYPAHILSLVGLEWDRALFPFADGINSFGVIAGATLVLFAPSLRAVSAPFRLAAWVVVVSCAIVLLMTDARAAMVFTFGILTLSLLPNKIFDFARWGPLAASFAPVMLMLVAPTMLGSLQGFQRPAGTMDAEVKAALTSELCPQGATPSSGALSNRPLIWEIVLRQLREPQPVHLVGFGYRGQLASGLSVHLSCIFLSYVHRNLASAHNIWLQTVLDIGYLGLVVVVGLIVLLTRRLTDLARTDGDPVASGMLLALLYIVLAGSLEATLSPDYNGIFYIFITTLVVYLAQQRRVTASVPQAT